MSGGGDGCLSLDRRERWGAGHLRRRVAHLLGQAVDGFGHRLHGRRVFVGVHLRESITAGTRSALTPKSVSSTETNPNLSHGQFLRGLSP